MRIRTGNSLHLIPICSLLALCCSFSFVANVRAQEGCTPVVYAFRHAEDFEEKNDLTPVGDQHADLYVGMVDQFGEANNFCPVGYVYSMYDRKTDGNPGTTNPYATAAPLARQACITRALLNGWHSPDDPCSDPASDFLPHMSLLVNGKALFLYEYMGTTKEEQKTGKSATQIDLRQELESNASEPVGSAPGLSSAIFWSSTGLNSLGLAIADGSQIPVKGDSKLGTPQRNAVYFFEYNGSTFTPQENVTQYLQCFNINLKTPTSTPGGLNYYCRKSPGDIPAIDGDLSPLRGKICDTTGLPVARNDLNGEAGYYFLGPCN